MVQFENNGVYQCESLICNNYMPTHYSHMQHASSKVGFWAHLPLRDLKGLTSPLTRPPRKQYIKQANQN